MADPFAAIAPKAYDPAMLPTPNHDAVAWLPPSAADKLRRLRQHERDCHAVLTPSEDLRELHAVRADHQRHLDRMLAPVGLGGFGLNDNDARVEAQRQKVGRATEEVRLATQRDDTRVGRWREAGHVARGVEDWLASGIPGGCGLTEVDDIAPADILKKGETATNALERVQRRSRELKADLNRVRGAPYTRKEAEEHIRQQVEQLAQRGRPYTAGVVEHLADVAFAETRQVATVYNIPDVSNAVAISNPVDVIGLLAAMFQKQMTDYLIGVMADDCDDDAALSREQREVQEAEVSGDLLDIERQEAALIWHLSAEGSSVWHRKDCSPLALLGLELETSARPASLGSSPGHSFHIAHEARP